MKSRIGIWMLGVLGMTIAVGGTAFADDDAQRDRHPKRGEHRGKRGDGDGGRERRREGGNQEGARDRMQEKAKRMRAFEEAMHEQRRQQRADQEAWRSHRSDRAKERRREIARIWGEIYKTPEGRAELALHADRMARLHRAQDIAHDRGDAALLARLKQLIDLEITRDAKALAQLRRAGRR